jgi:hypothetical protein
MYKGEISAHNTNTYPGSPILHSAALIQLLLKRLHFRTITHCSPVFGIAKEVGNTRRW